MQSSASMSNREVLLDLRQKELYQCRCSDDDAIWLTNEYLNLLGHLDPNPEYTCFPVLILNIVSTFRFSRYARRTLCLTLDGITFSIHTDYRQ